MSTNHSSPSPLEEIAAQLGRTTQIDRAAILHWMRTNDIEAMGALMDLLAQETHHQRVKPPLTFDDIYPFMTNYYERTLSESPDGEWSDSRTTAGWAFAKWFVQLWDDDSVPRNVLSDLKAMLERLCRKGDAGLCKALVTSVLEHLFLRTEVQNYFADWEDDSALKFPYDEASHLASVTQRRRSKT